MTIVPLHTSSDGSSLARFGGSAAIWQSDSSVAAAAHEGQLRLPTAADESALASGPHLRCAANGADEGGGGGAGAQRAEDKPMADKGTLDERVHVPLEKPSSPATVCLSRVRSAHAVLPKSPTRTSPLSHARESHPSRSSASPDRRGRGVGRARGLWLGGTRRPGGSGALGAATIHRGRARSAMFGHLLRPAAFAFDTAEESPAALAGGAMDGRWLRGEVGPDRVGVLRRRYGGCRSAAR